jgi:hypothetical protein
MEQITSTYKRIALLISQLMGPLNLFLSDYSFKFVKLIAFISFS